MSEHTVDGGVPASGEINVGALRADALRHQRLGLSPGVEALSAVDQLRGSVRQLVDAVELRVAQRSPEWGVRFRAGHIIADARMTLDACMGSDVYSATEYAQSLAYLVLDLAELVSVLTGSVHE